MKIASALVLVLAAACGGSSPSQKSSPPISSTSTSTAPPAVLEPASCGTVDFTSGVAPPDTHAIYQCVVDAFHENREASARWETVTDEGGRIIVTYRVLPGTDSAALEVITDDRDDGFAAEPGLHTQRCNTVRIENTAGGGVLYPEDCD